MSTSLYWSRIPVEPKEESLYDLKRDLAPIVWNSDGSLSEDYAIVGKDLLPFLRGVVAGGNGSDKAKDAQKLITAIEKYGEVRLCIHS